MSRTPRVTIIAGPNGAGKSTVAPLLLRTFGTKLYVNADTIARGLAGLEPERAALAAGRIMLLRLKELAHEQADFAFETTLASRSFAPFICALQGYESTLLFLYLRTPELAVQRVAERVQAGGHHIPKAVIERRYEAGLRNLFKLYLPVVDNWSIWDASSTGKAQLMAQQNKNSQTGATLIDNPLLWQQLEATYGSDHPRQIDLAEVQKVMERAVWQAVLRHKKLGESIAVWQGGRVVTLSAEEIEIPEDVDDL